MNNPTPKSAAVIGAGPAGLMAAEALAERGVKVTIFEKMPSPARKFLMAGRGGLNITHSEDYARFLMRYREATPRLARALHAFDSSAIQIWCESLGQPTFIGSSGRVFPKTMKSSPLLRAWLRRLEAYGVELRVRHTFIGWTDTGELIFETENAERKIIPADVTILALGGASWPRLGSDGRWNTALEKLGVTLAPFQPSNCGFELEWSPFLKAHSTGQPLKNIALHFGEETVRGECVLTPYGLEGGAVYALSASLRDATQRFGKAEVTIDLRPDSELHALTARLSHPRGKASLSNHLRKCAGINAVELMLLHETAAPFQTPEALALHIKALPLCLLRARSIERAISTAGGVVFDELDESFMLRHRPGVFCAGEMLDWEAPTGGYLMQACMATGRAAALGASEWLDKRDH